MSLDDIIKTKKRERPFVAKPKQKPGVRGGGVNKPGQQRPEARNQAAPRRVVDARDIICTKTRSKITDAREMLNQKMRRGDARDRLRNKAQGMKRRPSTHGGGGGGHVGNGGVANSNAGGGNRRFPQPPMVALYDTDMTQWMGRTITSYMDVDDGIDLTDTATERIYIPTQQTRRNDSPPLKRTVHNEVFSMPTTMPPLPSFRSVRAAGDSNLTPLGPVSLVDLPWSDPFQTYNRAMQRGNIIASPMPMPTIIQPRGILRKTTAPSASNVEHTPLSSSMKARLERAPNPSESMGIFAKMGSDSFKPQFKSAVVSKPPPAASAVVYRGQPDGSSLPSSPTAGYRIVVSNLHAKVIHQDIQELFGDIGDLIEARLVRPGVAEVIYRSLKDAEKAVDAYHNRQLDGQPMNCLLVNPRSSNKPTASAIASSKFQTR